MPLSSRQWTFRLWRRLHRYRRPALPISLGILGVGVGVMTSTASSATAAAALGVNEYSTSVSKIAGRSKLPEEAASNPHHIIKGGTVSGFKNPYPSWSNPPNLLSIFKSVIWYVLLLSAHESRYKIPVVAIALRPWRRDESILTKPSV